MSRPLSAHYAAAIYGALVGSLIAIIIAFAALKLGFVVPYGGVLMALIGSQCTTGGAIAGIAIAASRESRSRYYRSLASLAQQKLHEDETARTGTRVNQLPVVQ